MNKIREKRGITLVALVITIIILLILAGITISQLTNSGLFNNTQVAKQEYANATSREEDILKQYENAISTGEIASGRDTVTIPKEEYDYLKEKTSKLGKLLWSGEWTSDPITVVGISDYTMCVAKCSVGGTGTFLVQGGKISTLNTDYMDARGTETIVMNKRYSISGDTLTPISGSASFLYPSNPTADTWYTVENYQHREYSNTTKIIAIYGLF